ncbi:MAG: hypothetical protein LC105_07380 [Chitinophagales bacterium]|nr:hypothetical protein [Chitinophagales bacterium]
MLIIFKLLRRKDVQILLLILTLTFILYYPSLYYDFFYSLDDDWLIRYNSSIQDFSLKGIYGLFFIDNTDFHYHPITYLSYMIDYKLFGADSAFGYKAHNLLLHLGNGILVFIFIQKFIQKKWMALLIAFLFLIHPMNTESIVWPSVRRQSLFFFYFLLSINSYLFCVLKKEKNNLLFLLTLLFSVISMLSKASALILPFIFLLISFTVNKKIKKKAVCHFLIVLIFSIILFIINYQINENKSVWREFNYTGFQHLLFYGYSYFFYWVKTFLLYPQAIFYPSPPEGITQLSLKYFIYSFGAICILCLHVYHLLKKEYFYFFALMYYSITIAGMLNLLYFPQGDMPVLGSNFYYYHSSLGILLYLSLVLDRSLKKSFKIILLNISIISCMILTAIQLPTWKNSISLLENTVKYYPSEEMLYRLGMEYYFDKKDKEKTFQAFEQADNLGTNIWINNDWWFYMKKTMIYYDKGEYKRALENLEIAIAKHPDEEHLRYYCNIIKNTPADFSNSYNKVILQIINGHSH